MNANRRYQLPMTVAKYNRSQDECSTLAAQTLSLLLTKWKSGLFNTIPSFPTMDVEFYRIRIRCVDKIAFPCFLSLIQRLFHLQVANVRQILTSPALLESTSLIFAFGLDLFSSRTAPSNTFDVLSENFNKLQLVLTVSALGVAIMIARPMVQRKKLRERWYH